MAPGIGCHFSEGRNGVQLTKLDEQSSWLLPVKDSQKKEIRLPQGRPGWDGCLPVRLRLPLNWRGMGSVTCSLLQREGVGNSFVLNQHFPKGGGPTLRGGETSPKASDTDVK